MQSAEARAELRSRFLLILVIVAFAGMLHAPLEAALSATWGWVVAQIGGAL